jgi:hypothetical protein
MVLKGAARVPVQSTSRATLSPLATSFLISYFWLVITLLPRSAAAKIPAKSSRLPFERICWEGFPEQLLVRKTGRARRQSVRIRVLGGTAWPAQVSQVSVHVAFSCGVYRPERRKILANATREEFAIETWPIETDYWDLEMRSSSSSRERGQSSRRRRERARSARSLPPVWHVGQ